MFRSYQIIISELSSLLKLYLYYSIHKFNWYLQTRCCGSISVHSYTIKYIVKKKLCKCIIIVFDIYK